MHIKLERSGGFAGMSTTTDLDSEEVSVEEAYELYKMVVKSSFFSLPEKIESDNGSRDHYQLRLTVAHGEQEHTVETGDTTAPEELQPLIEHLSSWEQTKRRKKVKQFASSPSGDYSPAPSPSWYDADADDK